ncbi:MAG: replicative helicase [Mycobacterium sp.]|jgi:replicative DNA helicase|nr:replicative helicase [Mycobacterium sp.]
MMSVSVSNLRIMTAGEDPNSAIEVVDSNDLDGYGPPTQPKSMTESPLTRVARADNGSEVPLDQLMHCGEQPLLWSVDERMRLIRRRAAGRVVIRSRDVFRVSLASGRQLELTSGQHVLKVDGWKPLTELGVGSRIAVLRRLFEPVQLKRMYDSEVIMLAHMIGDGSCVKRQPIRYASIDEQNLAAVTTAAQHFGVTAIRDEYAAARVTTLRLPAPFRLTHGKRNPIAEWLDGLGLFGLRSYEKFVPAAVFALPNEQVALFLRHLWATDGSVRWDAKTSQGRVYYASTSRRLIDDVMHLLLRMGVQTRITRTTKAGYRDCWFLTIDRAANQIAFLTKVGVHGERGLKAKEVVGKLAGRIRRPGTDTIPVEI